MTNRFYILKADDPTGATAAGPFTKAESAVRQQADPSGKVITATQLETLRARELTHKEAAVFLGVHVQTLYGWAKKGLIPRYRREHGRGRGGEGRTFYLRPDLERFKAEQLPPEAAK